MFCKRVVNKARKYICKGNVLGSIWNGRVEEDTAKAAVVVWFYSFLIDEFLIFKLSYRDFTLLISWLIQNQNFNDSRTCCSQENDTSLIFTVHFKITFY